MKIDSYNSKKIKVLSFVLILLVLYIHSFYNEAIDTRLASSVQTFVGGGGIAIVAVPMFFVISGFLFFNNIGNVKNCFPKIKKRASSLLVPYLIWNCVFVLWYVVLQNLPGIGGMINSDMLTQIFAGSFIEGIDAMFVAPAAFQLWFLRDLIIIVMLSPLLYLLLKYGKWIVVVGLLLVTPYIKEVTETFNQFGIAYFAMGGAIAMYSDLITIDRFLTKPVVICSSFIYLVHAVMLSANVQLDFRYVGVISVLAAIITVWRLYDWIASNQSLTSKLTPLNSLLGYSFFIYLFHEPVFNIIKKIGLMVLGVHEWSLILLYLVNPLIMCMVAIAFAKLLQRYTPKVYAVLVGGR